MSGDPNNSRITNTIVGDAIVDSLSSRVFWGPTTITYAFPTARADYDPANYDPTSAYNETSQFSAFTTGQQNWVKNIMLTSYGNAAQDGFSIEGFTNVSFMLGANTSANIRFGNSAVDPGSLGWTYHAFPNEIQGGDVWIQSDQAGYSSPAAGNAAGWILLHELGHSMGLDHTWATTHDTSNVQTQLGQEYDDFEWSVMSYKSYTDANGASAGWGQAGATSLPQTFMRGDIYTLQYMYGADYTTNSGNTVYKWDGVSGDTTVNGATGIDAVGAKILATIWDGGGTDTYDLSAYTTNLTLNLVPGEGSNFGQQLADLGNNRNAAANIYNAYMFGGNTASLIENAIGGSGADSIKGNAVNNTLTGNQGADSLEGFTADDTLIGNGGLDVLNGGQGNDTLTGGVGASNQDTFLFKGTTLGQDIITDWQDGVDYIRFQSAAITSFAQVQANATQVGTSVVIDLPNNTDTITIQNWTLAQMSSGDFLFS